MAILRQHGIKVEGVAVDLGKMRSRKDAVVQQNNNGIAYLFKKNKVTLFHGLGSFVGGATTATRSRCGSDVSAPAKRSSRST